MRIERWPSEEPLRALVILAAILIWLGLGVSGVAGIVVIAGVALVGLALQLVARARLVGSCVQLGPQQLPPLYAHLRELAARFELAELPPVYLERSDRLETRALRILGRDAVVLSSGFLRACEHNPHLCDFGVAWALARVRAQQLRWRWALLPGLCVPILGSSYLRACTYTCDRYAFAMVGDRGRALEALTLLGAGPVPGWAVDRTAWVEQLREGRDLLGTLGEWLSSRPPLAARLVTLAPALAPDPPERSRGITLAAAAVVAGVVVAIGIGGRLGVVPWVQSFELALSADEVLEADAEAPASADPVELRAEVQRTLISLASAAEAQRRQVGSVPANGDELYAIWSELNPGREEPVDPYDGRRYGYNAEQGEYVIWSSGPDPEDESDDISYLSPGVQ